jgi:hypothetical protein
VPRQVRAQLSLCFQRQGIDVVEVGAELGDARGHRLLGLTKPDSRVVFLLVGLVFAVRVANGLLQVSLELLVVVEDARPVRPLVIRVDVDFL